MQEEEDMIRKIIHIDEEKCNGCGLCANACHEGAIDIVNGKAKLVREHYCDGLGDCLPSCPTGAITFEEREAPEYDDAAVKRTQEESRKAAANMTIEEISKIEDENERRKLMTAKLKAAGESGGCPGSRAMQFKREESEGAAPESAATESAAPGTFRSSKPVSRLAQWPCQIKLVPTQAPFFDGAKLLIAADCSAYAYVRNLTTSTIPKNSQKSSQKTTSRKLPSYAWRSRAAEDWRWLQRKPFRRAANSSHGRS